MCGGSAPAGVAAPRGELSDLGELRDRGELMAVGYRGGVDAALSAEGDDPICSVKAGLTELPLGNKVVSKLVPLLHFVMHRSRHHASTWRRYAPS